jgi:hypothetical protein
MPEVTAQRVSGFGQAIEPGQFYFTRYDDRDERRLNFRCPCGCGKLCVRSVRRDGTDRDGATAWNLDEDRPTFNRIVEIDHGHWIGRLTNGIFTSC